MQYRLKHNEEVLSLEVAADGQGRFTAAIGEVSHDVLYRRVSEAQMQLIVDGAQVSAFVSEAPGGRTVMVNGRAYFFEDAAARRARPAGRGSKGPRTVTPPMPAVVTKILVSEGESVEKGQGVVVVSAMKMDTTLTAPFDGIVARINVAEGDKVTPKQVLVDIEPVPEDGAGEVN